MILQQPYSKIQQALVLAYPLYPIFDVEEGDTHYVLSIDGRFITGNVIDIELLDDQLVIKGDGSKDNGNGFSPKDVIVRSHGRNIATQYRDGLLLVAIPKDTLKVIH